MPAQRLPAVLVPSLLILCAAWSEGEDAAPPKPAPPAPAQPTQTIAPVVVEGQRDLHDYKADTVSGTRIEAPLKETPQSVQVIPSELLQATGATSFMDAMRLVPGATLGSAEGSSTGDRVYLRGFLATNDVYLDGLRDNGSYIRDTYNTDHIEVLKGPASVLFGRGSTGGAINIVTKKPTDTWTGNASLTAGMFENFREVAGVGGPVLDDGLLDVRLDTMKQDSESFRDDVYAHRFAYAPSISSRVGGFEFLVQYNHQEEDSMFDPGQPMPHGRPADVPVSAFYGFPDDDFQTYKNSGWTGVAAYRFDEHWKIENKTRWNDYNRDFRPTTLQSFPAAPTAAVPAGQQARTQALRWNKFTSLDNTTEVDWKRKVAGHDVNLLGGAELIRERNDNKAKNSVPTAGNPTPQNVLIADPSSSPQTWGPGEATDLSGALNTNTIAISRTVAFYGLATVEILPGLTGVGGLRWDHFATTSTDNLAAANNAQRTDKLTSTRAGLVYDLTSEVALYGNFSNSFNPSAENVALSVANSALPPERTRTYEVGVKFESADKDLSASAAVFRIDKYDARYTDNSVTPSVVTLDGDTRVDGLELSATGRPVKMLSVYGGVSYLDAEVVDSRQRAAPVDSAVLVPVQGKTPIDTPELSGSLWVTAEWGAGFSSGLGMYAVSRRYGDNVNSDILPGYARFDAAATYQTKLTGYTGYIQVNVFNLLDTKYYDGDRNRFANPGAPLSGQITVGATW